MPKNAMPKKDEGVGQLELIKGANNVDDLLKSTDDDELIRGFSGDDELLGEGGTMSSGAALETTK